MANNDPGKPTPNGKQGTVKKATPQAPLKSAPSTATPAPSKQATKSIKAPGSGTRGGGKTVNKVAKQ